LPYNFDENYISKKHKYFSHPKGCILFTDIVSYCELSEKYIDIIIFLILNDMYSKFDKCLKKYKHLQKIETIGDAYMVAGDLDSMNYTEVMVIEIISFALDLLDIIQTIKTPSHNLQIRIGIHIGPFIVCILGLNKPRVCLVGKNINKAARLQSTAKENSIQISGELYDIFLKINKDKDISFVKNKNVALKNIGTLDTYTIFKKVVVL
jgi:guanylate cyclase